MSDESLRLVTIDREIMGGELVFRGTRVPIQTLIDYLLAGDTLDEFLYEFPSVTGVQAIDFIERSAAMFVEVNGTPAD